MGKKDVFSPEDGKNKKKSSEKHQNRKNSEDAGVEDGKRGMDILQPHHRDIPEQEDEGEEDQTGKDQQSDEDSLLRFKVQFNLNPFGVVSSPAFAEAATRRQVVRSILNIFHPELITPNSELNY